TSMAVTSARTTHTVKNSFGLPTWCPSDPFPCALIRSSPQVNGHQVDHGEHEHPDKVNEVPVQAADFHVVRRELAPGNTHSDYQQVDHHDGYVEHVQPGGAEERRAEQRHALGIAPGGVALVEQLDPFRHV